MAAIPDELTDFLQSGISLLVGSRDARMMPEIARIFGSRVEAAGRELTFFLPAATGARTLENARDNGRLAVCFTSVDHRSYQVKGRFLDVRAADDAERRAIERYRAALAQHFGAVGLPPRLVHRMNVWPAHAVRLAVEALFVQTPGPGAGVTLQTTRGKESA